MVTPGTDSVWARGIKRGELGAVCIGVADAEYGVSPRFALPGNTFLFAVESTVFCRRNRVVSKGSSPGGGGETEPSGNNKSGGLSVCPNTAEMFVAISQATTYKFQDMLNSFIAAMLLGQGSDVSLTKHTDLETGCRKRPSGQRRALSAKVIVDSEILASPMRHVWW